MNQNPLLPKIIYLPNYLTAPDTANMPQWSGLKTLGDTRQWAASPGGAAYTLLGVEGEAAAAGLHLPSFLKGRKEYCRFAEIVLDKGS